MANKHKGYSPWEPQWTLKERKESSRTRLIIHQVKKETFARWGYTRSSRFSDGILIGRFNNLERKQVFHQKLQLVEFMEDDDIRKEADQGIEDTSIKEIVERSLDDLKVK